MHPYKHSLLSLCLALLAASVPALALPDRAVVTNDQRLYREARLESKTVGRVTVGEEATVTAREGDLVQVSLSGDRAGWTLANGVVILDANPRAAGLLFDAAETIAQEDSADAWRAAAGLFRKAASLSQGGPYAPEALWRAAELSWRAEARSRGPLSTSSTQELSAVVHAYPKTAVAARAAFLLLRNSFCEHWDGGPGCPESELGLISKYLDEYPGSQYSAELRYALAYRHAALVEIYLQQGKPHFSAEKAVEHKAKAREVVDALLRQAGGTVWAARGERLLWSLENNVGVYSGIEVALRRF